MIIKSNNETIYNKILGAIVKMSSTPDDAIFAFTLMGIPIYIDVDNNIHEADAENPSDSLIYTDGRGIMIKGNIVQLNNLLNTYGTVNVLKHELEHILLNHISRSKDLIDSFTDYRKEDIMNLFNIGADYIINKDLGINNIFKRDLGFIDDDFMMKEFGLTNRDLDKKSVEEIVMLMLKNRPPLSLSELINTLKKIMKHDGFGGSSAFAHVSYKNINVFDDFVAKNTKDFGGDFDKYLAEIIKNAVTTYGYGQSKIWKKLNELYGEPLVDWKAVLTDELRQYKSHEIEENGMRAVNRRYYQLMSYINTPILFTNIKRTFKDGVIAIDTSSSIDDDTYIKEISEVIRLVKDEGIDWKILLFDDGIVVDDENKPVVYDTRNISLDELKEKLMNRTYGGTNIKEVLDYCEKEKSKFLILISDMMFSCDVPQYTNFKKIFISTLPKDETNERVEEICDTLTYFNPY